MIAEAIQDAADHVHAVALECVLTTENAFGHAVLGDATFYAYDDALNTLRSLLLSDGGTAIKKFAKEHRWRGTHSRDEAHLKREFALCAKGTLDFYSTWCRRSRVAKPALLVALSTLKDTQPLAWQALNSVGFEKLFPALNPEGVDHHGTFTSNACEVLHRVYEAVRTTTPTMAGCSWRSRSQRPGA